MKRASRRHRLILCNDGGTLVGPTAEAPIGAEGLVRLTIDPLRDTQIDTLYWQLGTDVYLGWYGCRLTDIYSHNTDVGPGWGTDRTQFPSAACWRIYENARRLAEEGTDAPSVVIEHGHDAGLEVFLSLRVNDVHDGLLRGTDEALLSPVKRSHAAWLLGPTASSTPDSDLHRLSRYAYNFALPEVRDYKLALFREAVGNYDLDGLDLDFCRFPRLFPAGAAIENAHLITDLLRSTRRIVAEKSKSSGRRICLSVRVPPTLELALAFGLDVKTWLDEGLVDILIAGVVYGNMFRIPVKEYIQAAQTSGAEVIAQNLGLFWFDRPHSAKVLWHEGDCYTDAMCRASAASYWAAGIDGLYLFNNHLIGFARDADYSRRPWKEIGSSDTLVGKDKHYLVDDTPRWQNMADEAGAPPIPKGILPAELRSIGDAATVSIDVADDIAPAVRDGTLQEATLRVLVEHLTANDTVEFAFNDSDLTVQGAGQRLLYNDCWIDFDVARMLQQGWNVLVITVMKRNPYVNTPLNLRSVEVFVRYREQPG